MSTKKNILLGVLLISLSSIPGAPVAALPPPEQLSIEQLDTVIDRIDEKLKQLKSKLKTEQVNVNVKGTVQVITYEALIRMLNQRVAQGWTQEQKNNALKSVLQKNPNITTLLKSIKTLTNTEKSYKEQKTVKEEEKKRKEEEERKKREKDEREKKDKENNQSKEPDISGKWTYQLLCDGNNPDVQDWTFTRNANGDYDYVGVGRGVNSITPAKGTANTNLDDTTGKLYINLSWDDEASKATFEYNPDTRTFKKVEGTGWSSDGGTRDCKAILIKGEPLKLSKAGGGPPRIFGMYNMQDKPQANVLERIDPPVISNNNRGDNVAGKSGKFGPDSFICTGVEVIRPRDGASVIKPLSATISYSTPPKTIQPGVPVDLQLNLSGAPGASAHGVWMASGLSPAGTVASVQSSYSLVEGKFDNEGNPISWPARGSSVFHSSAKVTWDGKGSAASLTVGCYCHGGSSTITWNYGFKSSNGPIARNNPLLDKMIRQGTNLDDDISWDNISGATTKPKNPQKTNNKLDDDISWDDLGSPSKAPPKPVRQAPPVIAQGAAAPRPNVEAKAKPSLNLSGVWNCQGRNTEMVMIDESGRAQSIDIPASAATFTTVSRITQQGNQLTMQSLSSSSRDGNSQASDPTPYTATLKGNSVIMRYSSPTSDTVTKLIYNPATDTFDGTSEMFQHSPGGKAGTKVITTMHMTRQ